MSTFKELKKRSKIKVWENKIKRLYASEDLLENDIKFLNIQFDLYKMRKTQIYVVSSFAGLLTYNFFYIKNLAFYKKVIIASSAMFLTYSLLRSKNRYHYETIINPYFEKYYIR